MIREYLERTWKQADEQNRLSIISLLPANPEVLLDLGCDDGSLTSRASGAIGATRALGVEIDEERASLARAKGIEVQVANLNGRIPLEDAIADAVMSNQVIEHLSNTDNLLAESWRLLKPGGTLVVSTENLSSWHNVFSLVMGWQPFSLTNTSAITLGVGNPLALHRGSPLSEGCMQHLRVFAPRALTELSQAHGFVSTTLVGAGYFPLGGTVASALSTLDWRHAAFITVKAKKPVGPRDGNRC